MFSPLEGEAAASLEQMNVKSGTANYSIPPISEDHLKLWLQAADPNFSMQDHHYFSNLFQPEIITNNNHTPNSSLEDVLLHGSLFTNNPSHGKSQVISEAKGVGGKESSESGEEGRRSKKRPRSIQMHNINERLRRKKISQKLTALQELIPNSVKKDQASTLDDAIKYIKTLQFLLQMMSTGTESQNLLYLPMVRLPQQQLHIPNLIPSKNVTIGYPFGYPNPCLLMQLSENNLPQFLGPVISSVYNCFGSNIGN